MICTVEFTHEDLLPVSKRKKIEDVMSRDLRVRMEIFHFATVVKYTDAQGNYKYMIHPERKLVDKVFQKSPYYDTVESAIRAAITDVAERGFSVNEDETIVDDEKDRYTKVSYHLYDKNGKQQKKMLHINMYRMESGKFELTHYVN